MTVRNRVFLAALWSLSLVAVAQWTASAQMNQIQSPITGPGNAVRFVPTKNANGMVTGTLMAQINGNWLTVTLDQPGNGMSVKPVGAR